MNTNKGATQTEEPTLEYVVMEDEFNILDEVFDELFEQVEKEIKQ